MIERPRSQALETVRVARDSELYALSALVFAIGAATTVYFSRSMSGGMEMPGGWTMSMMWMSMPGQSWSASAAMFLLMWLAMMLAMMLPSALPMLRNFRRVLAAQGTRRFAAPLTLAACGYFLVWLAVGGIVYVVGVPIAYAAMRWPDFSRAIPALSGSALLVAGSVQFTRWKMKGLHQCRDPLACAAIRIDDGRWAGWRQGLEQGASCVACCWPLMLVLLALGAMNLAVMTTVAVVIALEKLMPRPEPIVRLAGVLALGAGAVVIARSLL